MPPDTDVNLRDLEYLVAVADHRHFGAAAEACYVTQPTLSTQLKKLEAELGVTLIERTPRRIGLTPAGERIVASARTVLREVADIRSTARSASDPETGTVRLGIIPTLAPYLLPHVVPGVHERFPRLELLLVEDKTDVLLERLRAGRLDAAVLARPVDDNLLHEEPLFSEEFVLAVPSEHALADVAGPVSTAVLADHAVLLLDEGHCLRNQALDVCRLVGASEWPGFRATSLETLRQMVAAGVGITLLPRLAVQPPVPPYPGVRILRFAEPHPRRDIALYWRRSSPAVALLRRLGEALVALVPTLPDVA